MPSAADIAPATLLIAATLSFSDDVSLADSCFSLLMPRFSLAFRY
jgi:hypothetical protein